MKTIAKNQSKEPEQRTRASNLNERFPRVAPSPAGPVRRPSFGRPSQAKPPSARPGSLSTAGPKSSQPRPWAELQGDPAVVVGGKKEGEKTRPETTVLRMLRSRPRGANRTLLIGTLGGPAKRVFAASGFQRSLDVTRSAPLDVTQEPAAPGPPLRRPGAAPSH
jgi:hypothetical protein